MTVRFSPDHSTLEVDKGGRVAVASDGKFLCNGADCKIARGQMTTGSASDTVVTGLTRVFAAIADLEDARSAGCDSAQAVVGDQAGTPAAGSILINTWKATASGDTTPTAATSFSKKVNWVAFGV